MLKASIPRALVSLSPSKSCSLFRSCSFFHSRPASSLTSEFDSLPESKEDRALEAAVTREFSRYGTVFVKIRRDGNRMPFAFCQYTVSWQRAPWLDLF